MCVVMDNVGGEGPRLVPGPHQRPKVPAVVAALEKIGPNLERLDPQHALVYAVDRKLIDPSSVTTDVAKEFQQAVWMPDAKAAEMLELAGQHRRLGITKINEPLLKQYQRLLATDRKLTADGPALKDEIDEMVNKLHQSGYWLVKLYDRTLWLVGASDQKADIGVFFRHHL